MPLLPMTGTFKSPRSWAATARPTPHPITAPSTPPANERNNNRKSICVARYPTAQNRHFRASFSRVNQCHKKDPEPARDDNDRYHHGAQSRSLSLKLFRGGLFLFQRSERFLADFRACFPAGHDMRAQLDHLCVRQKFRHFGANFVDGRIAHADALECEDRVDPTRQFEQFLGVFQWDPDSDILFGTAFGVTLGNDKFSAHQLDFLADLQTEALLQFEPDHHRAIWNRLDQRLRGPFIRLGTSPRVPTRIIVRFSSGHLHFRVSVGRKCLTDRILERAIRWT